MRKCYNKMRKFFENIRAIFGIPVVLSFNAKKLRTQHKKIVNDFQYNCIRHYNIKVYVYTAVKTNTFDEIYLHNIYNRYLEMSDVISKINKITFIELLTKKKYIRFAEFNKQLDVKLSCVEASIDRFENYSNISIKLPPNKIVSPIVDPYGEEIWDK